MAIEEPLVVRVIEFEWFEGVLEGVVNMPDGRGNAGVGCQNLLPVMTKTGGSIAPILEH